MLSSVVAYFTAKNLEGSSLYSETLKKKAAATPANGTKLSSNQVGQLMRPEKCIPPDIARLVAASARQPAGQTCRRVDQRLLGERGRISHCAVG